MLWSHDQQQDIGKSSKTMPSLLVVESKEKAKKELSLLRCIVITEDTDDEETSEFLQLSKGGLTVVSSKMVKFGGDLLFEFNHLCGTTFNSEIPSLCQSIVTSDKLKSTFLECVKNIIGAKSGHYSEDVYSAVFTEVTSKIINSRINEMMKAQQQLDLRKEGKVVETSQSLRDTLKAYSISKQRLD